MVLYEIGRAQKEYGKNEPVADVGPSIKFPFNGCRVILISMLVEKRYLSLKSPQKAYNIFRIMTGTGG
ncbi:MAG: hypothetical protein CM1200mP24_05460 [Gammaproteobacteria bacterium]|nr:MAG: hypothetical protein CM1200mP24_05460 [Gammaproteobacteria bacterium]